MSEVNLAMEDAAELAEMLGFLNHWLSSDRERLSASLLNFVGHPAFSIDDLQEDLARFTFVLGGDAEDELFPPTDHDPNEPDSPF